MFFGFFIDFHSIFAYFNIFYGILCYVLHIFTNHVEFSPNFYHMIDVLFALIHILYGFSIFFGLFVNFHSISAYFHVLRYRVKYDSLLMSTTGLMSSLYYSTFCTILLYFLDFYRFSQRFCIFPSAMRHFTLYYCLFLQTLYDSPLSFCHIFETFLQLVHIS
jgi:hypothetical protein